jgi:hypothetical protein
MFVFELDRRFAIDVVVTELSPKPAEVVPILTKSQQKRSARPPEGLNDGDESCETPAC